MNIKDFSNLCIGDLIRNILSDQTAIVAEKSEQGGWFVVAGLDTAFRATNSYQWDFVSAEEKRKLLDSLTKVQP